MVLKHIKRELYLNKIEEFIDTDFIKVLTGIRRCGKTSIMFDIIDELKSGGINEENILFISFEDIKYNTIEDFKELNKIITDKVKDIDGKIYFFFDEIQNVSQWERSINAFRVSFDCDIFISTSYSKLLSSELSTLLAGRFIEIKIYPFSFKEYLQYTEEIKGITLNKYKEIELFEEEYIKFGGMPGLLEINDEQNKKDVLSGLYNTILIDDILSGFKISRIDLFQRFTGYMMNSVGQTFSAKSIRNYLKNRNIRTSDDTLLKYLNFLQLPYFLLKCRRQDLIGKKEMQIYEKYYLTDHGFHHAIVEDNYNKITGILENIVYIELLRRGFTVKVGKIYDKEIDFVCEKSGVYTYIQVSYKIFDEKTQKREFSPLLQINDKFDTYVITMDYMNRVVEGVKQISVIDFLKGDEIS